MDYDLDGKLLFARHMGEEFDKGDFGLKPVACETVAGYVFICLADQPADFEPMRKEVESYMAPHRIWEAKVAHESTIIEKGNWKLVWKTTASATIALQTTRNSAAPILKTPA